MTRTERASHPRAVARDHSEAKNGMDRHIPKNGAGPHNWGSLDDERDLELAADYDEQEEAVGKPVADESRPALERKITPEELSQAREIRRKAAKGDVDLASIARSSAAVSGSPKSYEVPATNDANTAKLN